MTESPINKVFVYGEMKVGGRLSGKFDNLRVRSEDGRTDGTMYDTGHNYPTVEFCTGDRVYGEVHTYNNFDDVLKLIDFMEGLPDIGRRRLIEVDIISGGFKRVEFMWAYRSYNIKLKSLEKIKCGTWPDECPF